MQSNEKMQVAVIGATGLAGQQFVAALSDHPWFEITAVAASSRSAGKSYVDAIRSEDGKVNWHGAGDLDERVAGLEVQNAEGFDARTVDLVFTAMDSAPSRELEPTYAAHTPVVSTASAFRYEDDVPLLLPGINMDHARLLEVQKKKRGWSGFVAPNPNCTTVGLAFALAPLHKTFGVKRVHMVSMQAVSGAGRSPGVIGLDIIDNIIPHIPGEEAKVERETLKILGALKGDHIEPAPFGVASTCTRIGVLEGHTEIVHVELDKKASESDVIEAWSSFGSDFCSEGYPSAPPRLVHYERDPFRPQVRLDRDRNDGMTTTIGRLREDHTADNGWKFVLTSHNTKMGAAKGCILVAEYLRRAKLVA